MKEPIIIHVIFIGLLIQAHFAKSSFLDYDEFSFANPTHDDDDVTINSVQNGKINFDGALQDEEIVVPVLEDVVVDDYDHDAVVVVDGDDHDSRFAPSLKYGDDDGDDGDGDFDDFDIHDREIAAYLGLEGNDNDDLMNIHDVPINYIKALDEVINTTENSNENETTPAGPFQNDIDTVGGVNLSLSHVDSTTSNISHKSVEDPIGNISIVNMTIDSVSLTWHHKHDKIIHCIYLVNGVSTPSFTIKSSEDHDEVNFTLFNLPSPGKEYDFSISCAIENGKEFTHFLKIRTKPSIIPRLNITSKKTNSVTLEWFQPGSMDYVEAFMDGQELTTNLNKSNEHVQLTIENLPESGSFYHVTLYVISNLMKSEPYDVHIATAPEQPGELEVREEHEYNVVLTWIQYGNFHDFAIKLNDTNAPFTYKFNGNMSTVTCTFFGEFSPGSYHILSVTSISVNGDESIPRIYEYVKDPLTPSQIKYLDANATSVCFSWMQQGHYDAIEVLGHNDHGRVRLKEWSYVVSENGKVDGCIVGTHDAYRGFIVRVVRRHLKTLSPIFFFSAFKPPSNLRVTNVEKDFAELWLEMSELSSINLPYQMLDFTITSSVPGFERSQYVAVTSFTIRTELSGLSPGTFYQVKVSGISPFYDDLPASEPLFFVTVPEQPSLFLKDIMEKTISLIKVVPRECDSIEVTISKFVYANPAIKGWPQEISFPCNQTSFQLANLEPNSKYRTLMRTLSIRYNSFIFNNHNESYQTKSSAAAQEFWTKPEPLQDLKASNVNSSSFTLDMKFSKNQTFETFGDLKHFSKAQLVSNRQREITDHYYTIQINVLNSSGFEVQKTRLACLLELYQIECPTSHSIIDLSPSSNYSVCVNIQNPGSHSSDKCIIIFTHPAIGYDDTLVIGILSTLLIILFLVVVFILFNKFIHTKPQIMIPSSKRSSQILGYQNQFFSLEVMENMKPEAVKVSDFENYLKKMNKNSKQQIDIQFSLLNQQSPEHTTHIAELPENRTKNRYSNILPFDHSRVKLGSQSDDATSDYINASFVPGPHNSGEYIATQAPLKETINDFWQMIYQNNVDVIVMLTNLFENGKERCTQYWPLNERMVEYGCTQVILKNELQLNRYIKRCLEITKDGECKMVEHFQFLSWPEMEGADDVRNIVNFMKTVRQHLLDKGSNSPLVVHCRAGSGRTGTFILIDRLYQQVKNQGSCGEVNIFDVALDLRSFRDHLIQTETQYRFVHDCLVYIIKSAEITPDAASQARMSISSSLTEYP